MQADRERNFPESGIGRYRNPLFRQRANVSYDSHTVLNAVLI